MLDTLGTITAPLHLGNNSWQHVFHLLRGSTQIALLGLDFLVLNRALLDYAHGTLQLWDTIIPLLCGKDLIPECCNVSITPATTLPPLSEMLVPVSVSPATPMDQSPDFVGYLKPNVQNKCECVVAHAVTSVRKGVTLAHAVNPTHQDITQREGISEGVFPGARIRNFASHACSGQDSLCYFIHGTTFGLSARVSCQPTAKRKKLLLC